MGNAPKPFGAIVMGYGYSDAGGPMAEYVPRELQRMQAWREATDQRPGVRNGEMETLKREQAERRKRLERGKTEGPPNPYRTR